MNGMSHFNLDDDLLRAMWSAGFSQLNISLVSTNTEVLQTLRRPSSQSHYESVVACAYRLGFAITSYHVLGLGCETLDSAIDALCVNARLPVLIGASVFYRTPDCKIDIDCSLPCSLSPAYQARSTSMAFETKYMTRDQIYTQFISCRIINFIKSMSIPKGDEVTLDEILENENSCLTERRQIGLISIRTLLRKGKLFAVTAQGLTRLGRFDSELFSRVWHRLRYITTQSGGRILITARTS